MCTKSKPVRNTSQKKDPTYRGSLFNVECVM